MSKDEAENLWESLRSQLATHYHVLSQRIDERDNMVYSDGLTHEGALGYVADLIEGDEDNDVAVVWIAEASGTDCPLAHGEDTTEEGESDGADEFLSNAMAQTPFWMAAEVEDPAKEQLPVSIVSLTQDGDDEYALELGDCMVIIKFEEPNGMRVEYPPGQLEKWQRVAWQHDRTVDDVVKEAIAAAFRQLEDGAN